MQQGRQVSFTTVVTNVSLIIFTDNIYGVVSRLWAGQLRNLGLIPGMGMRFSPSKCPD